MEYTTKELEKETCSSFGGNNCVLHQCMYNCVLDEARKKAKAKENGTDKRNDGVRKQD